MFFLSGVANEDVGAGDEDFDGAGLVAPGLAGVDLVAVLKQLGFNSADGAGGHVEEVSTAAAKIEELRSADQVKLRVFQVAALGLELLQQAGNTRVGILCRLVDFFAAINRAVREGDISNPHEILLDFLHDG